MRLFISYTSKDPNVTKDALIQLEQKITPFANVFIDLLHNKKGKLHRVYAELNRSDIVLQIVSLGYESKWVEKELYYARKMGKPILKASIKELIAMDEKTLYRLFSDAESINVTVDE